MQRFPGDRDIRGRRLGGNAMEEAIWNERIENCRLTVHALVHCSLTTERFWLDSEPYDESRLFAITDMCRRSLEID